MKTRKETFINNSFTIDSIITIYFLNFENDIHDDVVYDFWQLLYLDQGYFSFSLDNTTYQMLPGQMILCEPGKIRREIQHKNVRIGIISFRCTSYAISLLKNKLILLSDEQREILSHIFTYGLDKFRSVSDNQEYYGQEPDSKTSEFDLQFIKNNLELLLIELCQHTDCSEATFPLSKNQSNYFENQFLLVKEFLLKNIRCSLTLDDIVQGTSLSKSTLKRLFSRQLKCGVMHYFITLKMEEAQKLLRQSDMTLTQISEYLGFSSIHYFSRVFKKYIGLSPRQYSKSLI